MYARLTVDVVCGSFFLAFFCALAVTPLAIKIAPKIGAMDVPKDNRRMHKAAMPRFGGLAIFVGTMVSLLLFLREYDKITTVILGGTLIYALGVVDDIRGMSARVKFLGEFLVAVLMYSMGLRIEFVRWLFGSELYQFGTVLCFIVTVLWIVGITNTINLVDGLDGLAGGIAAIACISIAYVAYIHGDRYGMMIVCVAMVAVAGGAVGFLPFNFYPARVFMGDGGSLFLGFMIAALTVVGPLKRSTMVAVVIPVLVLGIPIFDTLLAIVRRAVNGKPIMQADKHHLHHHLMDSGYGQRRAVLMLYGISAVMGMAAVLMSRELFKDSIVLIAIAMVYLYVFLTEPDRKAPHLKEEEAKPGKNGTKWKHNRRKGRLTR